ncbi:MAG: DNA repair protein RecO [Chloroflexota bacterium]
MAERPRVYRTKGVVLKRIDLGEADKILTIYTSTNGKLRAVAKGVRRPSSRLGGHVDEFAYSDMLLARGRELDVVTQSQTLDPFRRMREELWRTSYGYYVTELVDSFTEERIENQPLFDLLVSTLRMLAERDDLITVVRSFELHLLDLVGYRPELTHCLECREEIRPVANHFSGGRGGVLCPACGQHDVTAVPISLSGLKVLRYLQRLDAPPPGGLRLEPATRREVEAVMRSCVEHLLERAVKSTAFLERLRLEESSGAYRTA